MKALNVKSAVMSCLGKSSLAETISILVCFFKLISSAGGYFFDSSADAIPELINVIPDFPD